MTSFYSTVLYSPFIVFLTGFLTFIALIGFGLAFLRVIKFALPTPWKEIIAVFLGIQSMSLAVQVVAISGYACKPVLTGIWAFVVIIGLFTFLWEYLVCQRIHITIPRGLMLLPVVLALIAALVNLLAAIAPSTKIDELYYHMITPSRIVTDNSLYYYKFPWMSAVLPQMIFQISLTPLHALGFPDAGNVVSWGLSMMLLWFGWTLVKEKFPSDTWRYLFISCLIIGLYPVIWDVTGGSYAMGDLATAAAIVALFLHKDLSEKMHFTNYLSVVSFLVLCSVSTKITLIPLGLAVLGCVFSLTMKSRFTAKNMVQALVYISVPWIVFFLPMVIWTWVKSGSPFGPVMAGFMGSHSVFDIKEIHWIFKHDQEVNMPSLLLICENFLIYFSPLMWGSVILFLVTKNIPAELRITGLVLVILQSLVLYFYLIYDPRYYGGLIQGLLVTMVIFSTRNDNYVKSFKDRRLFPGSIVLLLPWLILQFWFAFQFFPVSLGIEDKYKFYSEKIGFFKDYTELDKLLPPNAILIPNGSVRMNCVYAPRPVIFGYGDVPDNKPVYLFSINAIPGKNYQNYKVGAIVYSNDKAVTETFRNPFRLNSTGTLTVYKLLPKKKTGK